MREILFRAKRIDNGEWIIGDLSQHKTGKKFIKCGDARSSFQVDSNTICQYTGLFDKNGNKIWENDIVKVLERGIEISGGFIAFFNDYPGGWLITNKTMEARCSLCMRNNVEVIGNVFDNAELLKE